MSGSYNNIEAAIIQKFGKLKRSRGKSGIEFIVKCPGCGREKCYINPGKGLYVCFRCGERGSIRDLLGKEVSVGQRQIERVEPLPEGVVTPGSLVSLHHLDDNHPAISYLVSRNFDPLELNDKYGVRYCRNGELFGYIFDTTNTLIFPLWMNNRVVGWQARLLYNPDDLGDEECAAFGYMQDEDGDWVRPPKYFTNPGVQKGRVLFNYDNARLSQLVVICEGPFDAISVGRCAVATLGKGVADSQARLIKAYWDLAILLLDPGDADSETDNLLSQLVRSIYVVPVALKGYKDAGEAPRDEIWSQIITSVEARGLDLFRFKFTI